MTATAWTPTDRQHLADVPDNAPAESLWGRQHERTLLQDLLSRLRSGQSQVLVLRGGEGVGKTALLEYVAHQAHGCDVVRSAGLPGEEELPFAGLHQLCVPLLHFMDQLPSPQREALQRAFGLTHGPVPDRFLVGVATLSLLGAAAAEKPQVCLVNDTQWLDRDTMQVLSFVARRLMGQRVALVITCRSDDAEPGLTGLPELVVNGLPEDQARSLFHALMVGPVDGTVEARLMAEIRGNPRVLQETVAGLPFDDLSGGYGTPSVSASHRVATRYRKTLASMPPPTRKLLLVAAADPTGDAVLLWSASHELGLQTAALEPAVSAGLLELDDRVRFSHPLLRGLLYASASPHTRRVAHSTIADATDPEVHPDRRAWHRANAVSYTDETVAADLERHSTLAWERAGWPARSAFLTRSAELTPDPRRRAVRALTAAESKLRTGSHRDARRLLAMAQAGPLSDSHSAQASFLEACLTSRTSPRDDAAARVIDAASRVDANLREQAMAEAMRTAMTSGPMSLPPLGRASSTPYAGESTDVPGQLIEAAARLAGGTSGGAALTTEALVAVRDRAADDENDMLWLPLACCTAQAIRDDSTWRSLLSRLIRSARRTGALGTLPAALNSAALIELLTEGVAAARPLCIEADLVARTTGSPEPPHGRLLVAAWQGRLAEVSMLRAEIDLRSDGGHGLWSSAADLAEAVAGNGTGHYADALAAAERGVAAHRDGMRFASWCDVELVESAVRLGVPERAADALARLSATADDDATSWTAGLATRSRAMVSDTDEAEHLYLSAIGMLESTTVRAELARAHLVYGEWLRREGRRTDAREQLHTAHDTLAVLGLEAFTERARRELLATGGTPRRRTPDTLRALTPQEAQIARMARDGHSNSEIGEQLYLSHRTVEWHLRKVFMKMGITSRRQLEQCLPA